MGTPEYAPPEQYETAAGHTTPASDIYSMGATLYHALAGKAPPTATLRMADPTMFAPLRELAPRVSAGTETVIDKAMDLVRADRWETAEAMAAALGEQTAARRPSRPPAITPRRQPTKVMADAQSAALAPRRTITRRQFLYGALIAGGAIVGCGTAAAVGALVATNGQLFPGAQPSRTPAPTARAEAAATSRPTAVEPQPTPTPPELVPIRWFVGLDIGTLDEQIEVEEAWVADYNARQGEIQLALEVVAHDEANPILRTRIAAGDSPDVCGPMGVLRAGELLGLWLDLEDHLDASDSAYDLSDTHPSVTAVWRMPAHGLVGLPIGAYPSALYVNREPFDKAGLVYPPQAYEYVYEGSEWDIDLLQEIAKALTLDTNGRDAHSSRFDPTDIVQFGYHQQWADALGMASLFGGGTFVDEGGNAHCPDHWREAFHWYYDGIWYHHFMPNGEAQGRDVLGPGNPFSSGNLAMAHCHLWYTCCLGDVIDWDYGTVPSYSGQVTAKLHTDAIGVIKHSAHKEMAVKAASAIAASEELIASWIGGVGLPAHQSLQEEYLAKLDERFPHGVNWQTIVDGLDYTDVPNHESWMPNPYEARARILDFQSDLYNVSGLNVETAIDELVEDLQRIFEAG
jgi:multiple sugar transport system substrate-binding protein